MLLNLEDVIFFLMMRCPFWFIFEFDLQAFLFEIECLESVLCEAMKTTRLQSWKKNIACLYSKTHWWLSFGNLKKRKKLALLPKFPSFCVALSIPFHFFYFHSSNFLLCFLLCLLWLPSFWLHHTFIWYFSYIYCYLFLVIFLSLLLFSSLP